jgi:ABC-type branched-subunit amino acid transport system ATPase component
LVPLIFHPGTGEENLQGVSAQIQQNAQAIQHLENASNFQLHHTLQALQQAENVTVQQSAQLQHTFEALQHLKNATGMKQMRDENIFVEIKFNLDELKKYVTFLQGVIQRWGGVDMEFAEKSISISCRSR